VRSGQSGLMNTTTRPGAHPANRVGKRGEGKFRRASWDEALDFTAEKMLSIKESTGQRRWSSRPPQPVTGAVREPAQRIRLANYGTQRSLCFNAMITAFSLTYGIEEPSRNYEDVSSSC